MTFSQRIQLEDPPSLIGRSSEDYARNLEDYLRQAAAIIREGIPPGFLELTPEPVSLDQADGSAGSETSGWAAADHVHWIDLLLTAKGDSLTFDGTDYLREAVGADDTVLVAKAAEATGRYWRTVAELLVLLLTTKGDIVTRTAAGVVRKGVGADGLSLTTDSAETDGLRYGPKVVRPAQIVANQNDYNPGRFTVAYLSSDADRDITGLDATGAVDGETRVIWNDGTFVITLKYEDGASTAANRFTGQGTADIIVKPGFSATITRDTVTDGGTGRWRAREE